MPSLTIWNRLEPRCRNVDLSDALAARTHDPLWFLARQWQIGEFLGDDAGSPIVATVASVDAPLDRYAGPTGPAQHVPGSMPMEVWVEREGVRPRGTVLDYRQVAEAGLQFLRQLRAAKMDNYVDAYVAHYAITAPPAADLAGLDPPAAQLVGVVARRAPDGMRLAADLRAALPALPAQPVIPSPDNAVVLTVAKAFLAWYDALFDEPPIITSGPLAAAPPPSSAWVNERMEYSFALDATATDTPGAFAASRYAGERLSWTSFDHTATALGPSTAARPAVTRTLVPSPVGFKGMPARRFWEMEDATVDIGAIEAGPADLGRLMLREFALIYGNDWFIVPVPVVAGSASRITSLVVTDTFGIAQTIPHYSQTADGGKWRMFAVGGDVTPHRLLLPATLARGVTSDPIERVQLVRDEAANMAWAIERIVQGASGLPFDRASVPSAATTQSSPVSTGLRYQLGNSVPDAYIPFIPQPISTNQRRMQRATFLRTDGTPGTVSPFGRLLAVDVPLFEEEFAREGITLDRRYRLVRGSDGSTHLWITRRKEIGATVGASGLKFDSVIEE
jgi:hypothetical protein